MAIINSYPSITVTANDLLLVADVSEEGIPTKTTSVQGILDLANVGSSSVTSIIAGNGISVDQATGDVTVSANLSVSSDLPGLTFTNSPQGTLTIGINGAPSATQFLNGNGDWATPAGGGGGGMTSWNLTADNATTSIVVDGNTVDIEGGTKITTAAALTDTVTIDHDATTRTDTTSADSPGSGGTFTCIDTITQDATGHPTAVNVKTITLPASGTTYQAGPGINFDTTTTPDTIEVDYTGINNVVASAPTPPTSADDIALTDSIIYNKPSSNNAFKDSVSDLISLAIASSAIPETYFSVKSGSIVNAGNSANTSGLSAFGTVTATLTATGKYEISFTTAQSSTDYLVNLTFENTINIVSYARIKNKGTTKYTIEVYDSGNNLINELVNVVMYR